MANLLETDDNGPGSKQSEAAELVVTNETQLIL